MHQVCKLWPGCQRCRRACAMLWHSQSNCIRFASFGRAANAAAGRVQCCGIHKAAASGCQALAEVMVGRTPTESRLSYRGSTAADIACSVLEQSLMGFFCNPSNKIK